MASTSSVSSGSGPSQALLDSMNGTKSGGTATANSVDDMQNKFMTLLVTQMKNQDPLNPMDNAQVTSQMAQLSTVTGIDKVNETLKQLISTSQNDESYKAAAMIGHGVMVAGSSVQLASGTGLLGYSLNESADSVQLNIKDKNGNAVRTLDLGAQGVGMNPVQWDGKDNAGKTVADGNYTFELNATKGGKKVDGKAMAVAEVLSVSTGGTAGVKLNLRGAGSVGMTDVKQIL